MQFENRNENKSQPWVTPAGFSYHKYPQVKSIWPVETRGVQPSFANFREIVIYNFDATTGLKQRSVRLLFFVTRKTFGASFLELFVCSVSQRDPAFRGLLLGNAKERKNWEKLREASHVKSYLRSLRTFVRRFMRPVSRRLFKASVLSFYRVKPTFFLSSFFLHLTSARKYIYSLVRDNF